MKRRTPRAILAVVTAAVVTLSACGSADSPAPAADAAGSADDASAASATASSPAPAAASDPGLRPNLGVENADSPFPAVTVRDVVDDRWVQFADILPAEQPVLLWFWAPF